MSGLIYQTIVLSSKKGHNRYDLSYTVLRWYDLPFWRKFLSYNMADLLILTGLAGLLVSVVLLVLGWFLKFLYSFVF